MKVLELVGLVEQVGLELLAELVELVGLVELEELEELEERNMKKDYNIERIVAN